MDLASLCCKLRLSVDRDAAKVAPHRLLSSSDYHKEVAIEMRPLLLAVV